MLHDLFGNALIQKTENLGIPYMGSKRKYADTLLTVMLDRKPHCKYFYDLFGGGGAMSFAALQKGMTVFYNEKQADMVGLMEFIFDQMKKPRGTFGMFPDEYYKFVTREDFMRLKNESGVYAQFVRICYSFGNKQTTYMFNPELEKTKHLLHDAVVFQCQESLDKANNLVGASLQMPTDSTWNDRRLNLGLQIRRARKRCDLQQLERLQQLEPKITFTNLDYRDVKITTPIEETIIYLDPPYRGTAKYVEDFDYEAIDDCFRDIPYLAFMSEYSAPFDCIHEIETHSTLSQANSSKRVEKLFCNKT